MTSLRSKTFALSVVTGVLLVGSASAQLNTNVWYYGATDNSSSYGVTPDTTQSINWQDSWARDKGAAANYTNYYGSQGLQANLEVDPVIVNAIGGEQGMMLFGFDGTGLNSADVGTATLYLHQSFSHDETWTIHGLAPSNTNWDTVNMTWGDLDESSATDWSGDVLDASLVATEFGTFSTSGGATAQYISVDITDALKAYLDGTIAAIVFGSNQPTNDDVGSDNRWVVDSDDNLNSTLRPGLFVEPVPEASTAALLSLLGGFFFLRRRRS